MAPIATPSYYCDLVLLPTMKVGSESEVLIAFVQSAENISVHPSKFRAVLDLVCNQCDALGRKDGAVPIPEEEIKVGVLCNSKYDDGNWYRSLIKSVDYVGRTALLFFIDYGNSDRVAFQNILPLDSSLLFYPVQALSVQQANGASGFTEEELESFCSDVTTLKMKITKRLGNGLGDPEDMVAGSPTHEAMLMLIDEPILKCSEDELDGVCKNEEEEKGQNLVDLPKVPLLDLELIAVVTSPVSPKEEDSTAVTGNAVVEVEDEDRSRIEKSLGVLKNNVATLAGKIESETLSLRKEWTEFKLNNSKQDLAAGNAAVEVEQRARIEKSVGVLTNNVATLAGKIESEILSLRKEWAEFNSNTSQQDLAAANAAVEDEARVRIEKSLGVLKNNVATLAGKTESETFSLRKEWTEFKSNNSKQEDLVPLLLSSLRCKDELIDRMLKEKVEEKERTDKAINELKVKIAMRAITHT